MKEGGPLGAVTSITRSADCMLSGLCRPFFLVAGKHGILENTRAQFGHSVPKVFGMSGDHQLQGKVRFIANDRTHPKVS